MRPLNNKLKTQKINERKTTCISSTCQRYVVFLQYSKNKGLFDYIKERNYLSYYPQPLLDQKILEFLQEDMYFGDMSSELLPNKIVEASIQVKERGIVAGIPYAARVFELLGLKTQVKSSDGTEITPDQVILGVKGLIKDILSGERLSLNFLIRLSGIATTTRQFVEKLNTLPNPPIIAATRKTTPGFRFFEKYAVSIGGGDPHRMSLSDTILLKENHLLVFEDLKEAIQQAKRQSSFTKKIEVEVTSIEMAIEAAQAQADIIMFDNFEPSAIRKVVNHLIDNDLRTHVCLEASGGITLDNVIEFGKTGVDVLSTGILTHSSKGLDFSLIVNQ